MAQPAYAWLRSSQPDNPSVSDDPFADIPMAGSSTNPPTMNSQQTATNDDPFADTPIASGRKQYADTLGGSTEKYWDQFQAGMNELASSYYGNEARKKVGEYQAMEAQEQQPGVGFIPRAGLLGGEIVPPQQKTQRKEQIRQEIGEDLEKAKDYRTAAQNMPQPESVQRFMSGESGKGWWEDFKEDPVEIALGITARSGAASLVSLGAGVAGGVATASPVGAMAGAGAASGRMEYINSIMQGLDEQGIDWTNPDEFIKAINNDELMEPIKESALKRGIAIGFFDGAAAMLGGKILAPKGMIARSAGKSQLVNMPAQAAAQGLLGAGGEAGGQYWSEGEISDPRGVLAEAIGELTFAPVEAGATLLSVTRGSKGIAAERLKATNELIDTLVKKRQKAYASGDREQIAQVSSDLNQYLTIRNELQQQLQQSDTDTLLQSEQALNRQIDRIQQKLFTAKDADERQQITSKLTELNRRREQVTDAINSQSRTRTEPINLGRAEALTDVKLDREKRKQQLRVQEEELYRQKINPMNAASEAQQQVAQEGGDALEQQLAASGAYANARSVNEIADEVVAEEADIARQERIEQLQAEIANSIGARKVYLEKQLRNLMQVQPGQRQGLLTTAEPEPVTPEEEPYQPQDMRKVLRQNQERMRREREQAAEVEAQQQLQQQKDLAWTMAEEHQLRQQDLQDQISALEMHLMEVERQKDAESQRQADWDRAEIQRLQQELQETVPTNPAMAQAMRQAQVEAAGRQAETQRREERWNEYNLAERQRISHELIDEAVRTGQLGLLGEPIARAYAERGEIPPNLQERVTEAQAQEIEQGYQAQQAERGEQAQLSNEITRLQSHIQRQQEMTQAQQGWTAEQSAPGVMPQQQPAELTGLLEPNLTEVTGEEKRKAAKTEPKQVSHETPQQPQPEAITYKPGQLRMMRNIGRPATTLDGTDTGWKLSQARHAVVLIHPDTDEYQVFPTEGSKDSTERELATMEALSWAEDHPVTSVSDQVPADRMKDDDFIDAIAERRWNRFPESVREGMEKQHFHKGAEDLAKAIKDKNVDYLLSVVDQGGNSNKGSKLAFQWATGQEKIGLTAKANRKAVFDWAGWTDRDIARYEKEISDMKAEVREDRKKIDAKLAAHNTPIVLDGKASNLQQYIDNLIEQGATELRKSDDPIPRYFLMIPDTNRGVDLSAELGRQKGSKGLTKVAREYAEVAIAELKNKTTTKENKPVQVTESFEQRLREIGKEWIKDKQHRFYFNDIIKELSGMGVQVPHNAKLWYDRNTEFYGQENLPDEVFDAAVERLEALRTSLLAETEKAAKPTPKPKESETPKPSPVEGRSAGRKRKLIAIDDALSEAGDELAAVFREQVGKVSSGVDPVMLAKVLQIGVKAGSLYVQKGAIKFADWADNLLALMESKGVARNVVAPYLKQLYLATAGSEDIDDATVSQMDDARAVRGFDVGLLVEEQPSPPQPGKPKSVKTVSRGITEENGEWRGSPYKRIADSRKVFPTPSVVAQWLHNLKPGDLIIDKFGNKLGVMASRQGSRIKIVGHDADGNYFSRVHPVSEYMNTKENRQKLKVELDRLASNNQQTTEPGTPTVTEPEPTTEPEPIKQTTPTQYGENLPTVTHTTKKGKELTGVVDTRLTREQAKAIDPFSFKKDNGWFIRDFRVDEYNDKLSAGTMEPVHPVEESTDENAERSGEGTLEGEPAGQVPEVPGGGDTGERSGDYTGESGEHDLGPDGRRVRSELGGSEAESLLGTDLHSAGAVSDRETGSGGRGVLQGDIRLGEGREGGVNSGAADYTITEADDLEGASFKQGEKFSHNIEAIKLLKELGDRPATKEQQAILARYVGWGGLKQAFYREDGSVAKGWEKRAAELKELLTPEEYAAARSSTLNAHYTTPSVVNAIYAGLEKLGFTHGRVLEPSVGVGNFFGLMPKEIRAKSNLVGVELDNITGGIASKLYGGNARITAPMGFENFDIAENSFDLVIGNPPFGDETITDLKHRDISGLRIHNYFFAKSMKALRPGGVMAMVVSKGFMDSTKNQKGREKMYREARLLGAYRLPNEAFKANANADVTTDIIFLQKRDEPLTGEVDYSDRKASRKAGPDYRAREVFIGADGNEMKINRYFVTYSDNLLGDMIMNKGRFGSDLEPAMTQREGMDWKTELNKRVATIDSGRKEKIYHPEKNVEPAGTVGVDDASTDLQKAEVDGLYINDSGELYRRMPDLEGETRGEPVTGYINSKGEEKAFRDKDIEKLKAAVELARTVRNLINMQVKELTDQQLQPLRDQLNREYDAFIKKYQMLNRPVNKRLLNNGDLTIAPMLMALENNYKKEKTVNGRKVKESSQKADIFTRRTQEPYTDVTRVSSPEEALIVSLAQTGRVDMDRMAELYGQSKLEITAKLTGQIYDDPQEGWVTRDEYLSGNVKLKLRQAKEAGKGYEDNVKALEEVQPEDISPQDITVSLGASWQTPDVINEFYQYLGGLEPESAFIPQQNFWSFRASKEADKDKAHKWITEDIHLKDLFTKLLNNKPIAIYKTVSMDGTRRLDVRATDAAQAKAKEIQDEFSTWLWRDTQRREKMTRRYNDLMNTHKTRQFDGSFLSFPGKISDAIIKLRETQANAVWRILQSPTTLLDHVVGAGKTFTMIAGAMELKRTGLAKKPLIVVPNHLVPQWAEDFARLYPNAKVLAARKEDFNKHKRREMLARIATGDWDAVIMAHTSFGKMPTDPESEESFMQEQLQDLTIAIKAMREAEGKKSRSVREAENQKKKLEEKLKETLENTAKDTGMTWNETGVDALFLDEAHEFKNLQFYTGMQRVKNINPAGSQKAQDLFIKIRGLMKKTGGRNLVFATGTPISNSMAELFTMQRYLAYDQLKESGLSHFDAWARTFGMTDTRQERKSSGKFGPVSRFSKFVNLPELMSMYRQFADSINNEDIKAALEKEGKGVHIPKVKGGKPTPVVAPRSLYQEAYMGLIEDRFANMPDNPSIDNPLKATNDARKAGLDMRMIYPELPDIKDSKINRSINNMMDLYHKWQDDKGTQLIFCDLSTPKSAQAKEIAEFRKQVQEAASSDESTRKNRIKNMPIAELYSYLEDMAQEGNEKAINRLEKITPDQIAGWTSTFDVYNDIKQKLITRGVPESEIAFIHQANTDLQKEELFAKVNNGEVRFLLGSTAKMGAGTNVQERLVALHHMDAPWRPSDLEQREGRIIRQGNSLFKRDPEEFEVEILRYATEQTYDVNMWQTLEVKARFIEQVRNGDTSQRQANDVAGESASAAEMKAASSGDPRIMEQVEIAARLKTLDNMRQTHNRDRTYAVMDAEREKSRKKQLPATIAAIQKDIDRIQPQQKGRPQFTNPDSMSFNKSKEAEDWLRTEIYAQALDSDSPLWEGTNLGSFRGLGVYGELYRYGMYEGDVPAIRLYLTGERDHQIIALPLEEVKWGGLFTKFNNTINQIPFELETEQNYLKYINDRIASAEKRASETFKYEDEYQQKNERNQQLMEELGAEQEVNQAATQLPEFLVLTELKEDHQAKADAAQSTGDIEHYLHNTAMAHRAGKLASSIGYSKPGKETQAAETALQKAKEQGLRITQEDLRRAKEAIATRPEPEAEVTEASTAQATETPPEAPKFTSVDDLVNDMLKNKKRAKADNGAVTISREKPGRWRIYLDSEDNDLVSDDTLIKLMGGESFGYMASIPYHGFSEDRLSSVVRYLNEKVQFEGLQPEGTTSNQPDMPVHYSKGEHQASTSGKTLSKREALDEATRFFKGLSLPSGKVKIEVYESIEEFYDVHPGYSEEAKKAIGTPYGFVIPDRGGRGKNKTSAPRSWRVVGFSNVHTTPQDFRDTLRHEIFGHLGLDTLTKEDKKQLLQAVSETRNLSLVPEEERNFFKKQWQYIDKTYSDHTEQDKAEEFIAHTAHDMAKAKTGKLKQLWQTIIRLFRRSGLIREPRSKQDIVDLLHELKGRLERGEPYQFHDVETQPEKNRENILQNIPAGKTDNIHFRKSDNSASFTAPKGRDQPSRFFNTQALAESQLIKRFVRTRNSLMVPIRKGMLPSMGLRQIVDTYEKIFAPLAGQTWEMLGVSKGNPITNYQQFVQGMQSLKSNKLKDADDIDIDWGRLAKENRQDYEALADIFHRSTLYEVFPDQKDFNPHEDMKKLLMEYAQAKDPKHQAALRKRMMHERERKAEHRKLHAEYMALSDQARKVYKGVEKYYEDMWADQQKALEDKIKRSIHDDEGRQVFLKQLKAKFHEAKIRGPYFPLQRFGPFFVIAEDENGEYYRAHFETEAKLHKEMDTLKREGMRVMSYGLIPDFTSRKLEGVSEFADQIHLSLDSDKFAGVSEKVKDEIRNEVNQLALQLMPDVSAAKHMIRRKRVKGFNENARRAFAYNAIHSSNRLARTTYGDRMATQLERIHEDIDAKNQEPYIPMKDRTIAAQVLSELEKQHEHIMNPKGSVWSARITNLAFIWYLGASAGAGLINLTQTPLIGIPLMGGRFGYRKTSAAMMKAAKDFALHGYNKVSLRESVFTLSKADNGISKDEKAMLEQLIDDGTIDTTQTTTLAQISDTDLKAEAQVQQDVWVKVNRLLGFFFHNAETANREVTALATYRLARKEGLNHDMAMEQARKMTFDAHFDYSGANRPRVMKNDWMKVFTIFKQYSQNMTYTLMRNFIDSLPYRELPAREKKAARKALAGILFTHAIAAGTLGLPLISWIGPVLAAAFGDDDDEFKDWRIMYRNWLADLFGKQAGEAIAKGVINGFTGADLHSRVSINELWIRSPNWEMSAREESMHYLMQGLGPAVSAAVNVFWIGPEQIAEGNTWKGIEKMVPKFIRDGIRTWRYSTEGATVGKEGYMAVIEDFQPWELGLQAFGLAPSRLGEAYEARSAVKNIQSRLQDKRQKLTTDYARAVRAGDYQVANQVLKDITDFNIAYPAFGITPQGLRRSIQMRHRYETLSEAGIYLPQAQMGLLKEARFAL